MMWTFVAVALAAGIGLLLWGRARARSDGQLEEALPECRLVDLEPGRFRVTGRVVPITTTESAVDGAACVYVERAEYTTVGARFVPLMREVEHGASCHPFYLDDGTGRLWVDPATALIECATATADGGLTAERRLRSGEEVVLSASFEPSTGQLDDEGDGPYRASARKWRAVPDPSDPPRLSHRTEEGMVRPPPDELTAFLGGAGAMMVAMGALLAFVVAFVL
ncbi:MAG TPA: hypothetical protein RMH99_04040 [Sandaracinaceae bacterium LLY-WYZ-13_1]|nr:hypothetical protein [Sandaracinaceae bacterium LLY-WYZ-13_1]